MTVLAGFRGELAALAAALLWSVAALLYRRVGERIAPLELNLTKGVLALLLLGLVIAAGGDSLAAVRPLGIGLLLLSGAVGIGLGDTLYFEALNNLGARRALLVGMLAPPLSGLLALLFLGERLAAGAWLGILLTLLGVAWVVTERVSGADGGGSIWRGAGFGMLAALTQAGGAVLSRAAFTQTSVSPLWSAFLRLAAWLIVLLVWIGAARLPVGRWQRAPGSAGVWKRLLLAVFGGTFLGIWLQQVSLKYAAAGIGQTLLSTSPLFVLPIAALLGERISPRAVLGAMVALLGVGLLFGLG